MLFDDRLPEQSWTAQEVLRICGNGALYILSHHDLVDTVVSCMFVQTSQH